MWNPSLCMSNAINIVPLMFIPWSISPSQYMFIKIYNLMICNDIALVNYLNDMVNLSYTSNCLIKPLHPHCSTWGSIKTNVMCTVCGCGKPHIEIGSFTISGVLIIYVGDPTTAHTHFDLSQLVQIIESKLITHRSDLNVLGFFPLYVFWFNKEYDWRRMN